jgi:hypothetical protein
MHSAVTEKKDCAFACRPTHDGVADVGPGAKFTP